MTYRTRRATSCRAPIITQAPNLFGASIIRWRILTDWKIANYQASSADRPKVHQMAFLGGRRRGTCGAAVSPVKSTACGAIRERTHNLLVQLCGIACRQPRCGNGKILANGQFPDGLE